MLSKEESLKLELKPRGLDKSVTIKDYFKALLLELWNEKESFSGKRPFGDSGWEYDLYKPLIKHGVIEGILDEYGDIEEVDIKKANTIISNLIKECFK